MEIVLSCPNCGNDRFDLRNEDGAFRCDKCGEYAFTEDMSAKTTDDNGNDLSNDDKEETK